MTSHRSSHFAIATPLEWSSHHRPPNISRQATSFKLAAMTLQRFETWSNFQASSCFSSSPRTPRGLWKSLGHTKCLSDKLDLMALKVKTHRCLRGHFSLLSESSSLHNSTFLTFLTVGVAFSSPSFLVFFVLGFGLGLASSIFSPSPPSSPSSALRFFTALSGTIHKLIVRKWLKSSVNIQRQCGPVPTCPILGKTAGSLPLTWPSWCRKWAPPHNQHQKTIIEYLNLFVW